MRELRTGKVHSGQGSQVLVPLQGRRHAILEHAADAFVEMDTSGLITGWNAQAEALFGWSRAEAMGRQFSERMVATDCRPAYDQALEKFFRSGTEPVRGRWLETTARHRDGHEFPIELAASSVHQDEHCRMAAFARDMSREKELDKEAEKRHRAIMDQLGEAYTETDLRGKYVYTSKGYHELFDRPQDPAGTSFRDLFDHQTNKVLEDTFKSVYNTGESAKIEYLSRRREGGPEKSIELSTSMRRDFRGRPVGFMSISHDCTRRKRAEIELVKTKDEAEAANKAKSEFLANMSHEIRTPLNGVLGMLELAGGTDLNSEQRELLALAQSAGGSLLAVIHNILDFSKIEAGTMELERIAFDLREAVSQAVRTIAISAHSKGLGLSSFVAPDIPQFFRGDPVRLKQVLINLLGNAVKFTSGGVLSLRVQPGEFHGDKTELVFSVSDTGIGISPEKQKLIFAPFSQEDASTTRRFGGTGLGLAICSRIVRLMGGTIRVESEKDHGSIFHFTVALETTEGVNVGPAVTGAASHAPEKTEQFKILLAEDNLVNQRLAVRLLQRYGHRVHVANNGREALAELAQQDFDLVLMDVQMPEMDGFTATMTIRRGERQTKAHLPIVALTAHAMKGDRERCLEAGMDDYIAKPINPGELRQTMERVMQACSQRGIAKRS